MSSKNFDNFCAKINYNFNNKLLLDEALTHPSLSKENNKQPNYQRLEFLGDKVLSLVIGNFLMSKYKDEMEGDLSKRHAHLVAGSTLSEIALKINIDQVIQISRGEKNLGGNTNKRNLENALEALIGAIYLDSSYQEAEKFIMRFWQDHLQKKCDPPKDPVSELQELIQLKSKQLPVYHTEKKGGFDHAPLFVSSIRIPYLDVEFSAEGKSKKEAQREVAKVALEGLKKS